MKILVLALTVLLLTSCDRARESAKSGTPPSSLAERMERKAILKTSALASFDPESRIDVVDSATKTIVATATGAQSSVSVPAGASYECLGYLYQLGQPYCTETPIKGTVTIPPTAVTASCPMTCVRNGAIEVIDSGALLVVELPITFVTPSVPNPPPAPTQTTRILSLTSNPEAFTFQFAGDARGIVDGSSKSIINEVLDHDYYEAQIVAPFDAQAGDTVNVSARILSAGGSSVAGVRSEVVKPGTWTLMAGKTMPVGGDMTFAFTFTAPTTGSFQFSPVQAGLATGTFKLVEATVDIVRSGAVDIYAGDWHYTAAEEAATTTSEGGGGVNPLLSYDPDPANPAAFSTGLGYPVNAGARYTPCIDGDLFYDYRVFRSFDACWGRDVTDRHLGIDINGEFGGDSDLGLSVNSIANGVVLFAGWVSSSWGYVIVIGHYAEPGKAFQLADGTLTDRFFSMYAHVQNVAVSKGTVVKIGQQIAEIGKNCGPTCSAHLHFEIIAGSAAHPANTAAVPGPGYYDARVCPDPACGRVEPHAFIAANNTLLTSCSGSVSGPSSGVPGQAITVSATSTCAASTLSVSVGGVEKVLTTFSGSTSQSYALPSDGASARFALQVNGGEIAAHTVTILQPITLTAPFLLDPLLLPGNKVLIQATSSYAGDGEVTRYDIRFGTFAGNTNAPFDPQNGEGNSYGVVSEIQWPSPEHLVGSSGSQYSYCYRARAIREAGGQVFGSSPWSNQTCVFVP